MRSPLNLDGIWDFSWYGDQKPAFPITYNDVTAVPGCFDLSEPYCGKRGWAVYRRFVTIDGKVRLFIDGLGIEAAVYWDEKQIGACKYAYMPEEFWFDAGEERRHELTIVINNCHNGIFHPYFDFYAYGGIYGSVTIERVPEHAVTQVLVSTEDYKTGLIKVCAKAADNYSGKASLSFDTGLGAESDFVDGALCCKLQIPDYKLWDTEHPYLHELTLKTETDEVSTTFGIRHVETQGRQILLNGKAIKLLGYNRHESFPLLGAAVPPNMMEVDLKLLRDQGCNFIRGSHYPQRRRFLELCDRMGILVWEETLGWRIYPPVLHSPEYLETQLEQARKLTLISYNNPCIIIRGFLNENGSQTEPTRDVIKALYDEIHALDPHCLISYASDNHQKDVCYDLTDVVSVNVYPGWYDANHEETSGIHNIRPFIRRLSDDMPQDKPFLITEIGAEALYGFRDPLKVRWSEEYQAELLMEACKYAMENDDCAGIAMWHFADARSFVTGNEIYSRARGINNKGVLDEYRRPKLSWYRLKEYFKSFSK